MHSSNQGLSIIELLVGSVIASIITIAGVTLVVAQFKSHKKMELETDLGAARGILEMIAHGEGCTLSTQNLRIAPPTTTNPNWGIDVSTPLDLRLGSGMRFSAMEFGSWLHAGQSVSLTSCNDTVSPYSPCVSTALPASASFQAMLNVTLQVTGLGIISPQRMITAPVTLFATRQGGNLVLDGCRPRRAPGGGGGSSFTPEQLCKSIGPGGQVSGSISEPVWTGTGCDVRKIVCLALKAADWDVPTDSCNPVGGLRESFQDKILSVVSTSGACPPSIPNGYTTFMQGMSLRAHMNPGWPCGVPRTPTQTPPACDGTGCIRLGANVDTRSPCVASDRVPEIYLFESGGPRISAGCGDIEPQGRQLCDAQCTP